MTRRRRVALWAGAGCVVVGLALLGYVGWQLIGTNILSERRQEALVEELQEQWHDDSASTASSRDSGPLGSGASALVRIPAFGEDYVMPVLEGVDDENLASGLAHFADSARAGQKGNYALAGHRITHGEPLRDLPELAPGDEVLVETHDAVYTYVLDTHPEDLVVGFDDMWVVDPRPVNQDPNGVGPADHPRLLTLTTCAELFHTDDRMIAFGHLESVRRR
jgi:sortase A